MAARILAVNVYSTISTKITEQINKLTYLDELTHLIRE